jgi:protein gp37
MAQTTSIAWTDRTWNPWRGCQKISPGCANCYMFAAQRRFGRDPGTVTRTKTWRDPFRWQAEAEETDQRFRVFTCSWSDWFHESADSWRGEAWDVVRQTPRLIYQILTKRPAGIDPRLPLDWGKGYENVWLGVSVENRRHGLPRIDRLREVPAALRFLSIEPLLEDLGEIDLSGIGWVIVGGESGAGWRPMEHDWALSIRDQCLEHNVPFFFKQSSAPRPESGILLAGKVHREFPR